MRMKHWILTLTLCLLGTATAAPAAALHRIETSDVRDIFAHIDGGTLVVFHIEDTVVETAHMLGSEAWGDLMIRRAGLRGLTPAQARAELMPLWSRVYMEAVVKPVDPSVQSAIRSMQRRGVRLMGLTDKDPEIAGTRLEHLRLCDCRIGLTAPHTGIYQIQGLRSAAKIVHGLLFTGTANNPGTALTLLLEELGYYPSKVIMVSNQVAILHEVERALTDRGISYVGCRLTLADAKRNNFRPEIAEVQLSLLNGVMSDEAARVLKPGGTGFWPF